MDDDDFGIAALEDPAPQASSAPHVLDVDTASKKAPKRRLRYRPDIDVSGKRYDGRKVSRSDLDLDTDYPIQDRDNLDETVDASEDSGDGDKNTRNPDVEELAHELEVNADAAKEKDAEERALAERLKASKQSDDLRSQAVRKQKVMYFLYAVNLKGLELMMLPTC